MPPTTLIEHQTLRTIVDNVQQARADIAQAFTLLQGVKERMGIVLGTDGRMSYGHLWSDRISDSDLLQTSAAVQTQQERNAWRYVIDQCGLQAYMTERRKKELHEQLASGTFPPLTVDNILSTLRSLSSQVGTLMEESAKEVFDWLRPSTKWGVGALKTNKRYRVGPKAIVGSTVEPEYGGGFRLHYGSGRDHLRALGNVLSLLDGQGAQQYPHDLCTQLTEALRHAESGEEVQTPYVACRPFKNGNLHLRFLRLELIDRLNQISADGTLPGTEQ